MEDLFRHYFWIIFAVLGMVIGMISVWSTFKTRQKELDILRTYAERGAEPPPQVLQSIMVDSKPTPTGPAAWPNFAFYLVMTLGFGGLAFWLHRSPEAFIFTLGLAITGICMAAFMLKYLLSALSPSRDGGK